MKKLLYVFPIVALLAAGCNSNQPSYSPSPAVNNPSPSPTTPSGVPASALTKEQVIAITNKDWGGNPANYEITAYLQNNYWYVDYKPKPDPNCTNCIISGGDTHYVVDAKTGAIISKQIGQ